MAEMSMISVSGTRGCPRNVANSAVILVNYRPSTAVDFLGERPRDRELVVVTRSGGRRLTATKSAPRHD